MPYLGSKGYPLGTKGGIVAMRLLVRVEQLATGNLILLSASRSGGLPYGTSAEADRVVDAVIIAHCCCRRIRSSKSEGNGSFKE